MIYVTSLIMGIIGIVGTTLFFVLWLREVIKKENKNDWQRKIGFN